MGGGTPPFRCHLSGAMAQAGADTHTAMCGVLEHAAQRGTASLRPPGAMCGLRRHGPGDRLVPCLLPGVRPARWQLEDLLLLLPAALRAPLPA